MSDCEWWMVMSAYKWRMKCYAVLYYREVQMGGSSRGVGEKVSHCRSEQDRGPSSKVQSDKHKNRRDMKIKNRRDMKIKNRRDMKIINRRDMKIINRK
jgi:hypothetical protein